MKEFTNAQIEFLNRVAEKGIGVDNSQEALSKLLYNARPAMLEEQRQIIEMDSNNHLKANFQRLIRARRKIR